MADTNAAADAAAQADDYDKFAELPDAPPKRHLKLSWVGKTAAFVIAVWIFLACFGMFLAPYHEADMLAEDSYLPSYYQHVHC